MCCVITALLLLGPRLSILVWWLVDSARFHAAFSTWIVPLLGALILPWTTLAYLLVFRGGVVGLDWLWLGVGLLLDLTASGGGYRHRERIPGYHR